MTVRDVYRNVINLEPGSAYELCTNRFIDIRLVNPKHSGEFPAATLIGKFGNFGVMLNQNKLVSRTYRVHAAA